MPPIKNTLTRLVEQLGPALPNGAREVVRAALGIGEAATAGATPSFPCLARPGSLPDLSALLGRRGRPPAGAPADERAGGFTRHTLDTPGGRYDYKLFVPTSSPPFRGLVVMLHGCTQDADDFAAGTRMNALAAANGLVVVYPEQARSANPSRCWNWFLPQNQKRDGGEAAAIAAISRAVMKSQGIAPGQAFVAGLSAGGAMAAIMAETYPELFAGVGIHSGLPVGAAHDMASAFQAMRSPRAQAATEVAPLGKGVPVIVFHGDADSTVAPANATAIVARLNAREAGLKPSTEKGRSDKGRAFARTLGRDAAGQLRYESWTIAGAPHAWSGGAAAGSYTDPAGPDASAEMVRFFLEQLGSRSPSHRPGRLAVG